MGDGQENGARRRILVVANETVAGRELREEIVARAALADVEVFILCPALNSKIRHWFSDDDGARVRTTERLEASLDVLAEVGLRAQGDIGDSNPLQAMDDAVRVFRPHEIIVSTAAKALAAAAPADDENAVAVMGVLAELHLA